MQDDCSLMKDILQHKFIRFGYSAVFEGDDGKCD